MAHCDACHIEVAESLNYCPLCGKTLYTEAEVAERAEAPLRTAYPEIPFSYKRAQFRRRLNRSFNLAALIPSVVCYIINLLTWQGSAWWFYVFVGLTGGWVLTKVPQRLPRPRTTYLVFIVELMALFYVGLISLALDGGAWYFAYAVPGIVFCADTTIVTATALMRRALAKAYSPLLLQCVIGLLPLILALSTGNALTFSVICALASLVFFLWFVWVGRTWLGGEFRRKLHR